MASSSNSPCAACKCLRRKCTIECAFAPYFPGNNPQKFSNVHRVFGASNVSKLINERPSAEREDLVNSLAYEAECRLRDPVYGCVGHISTLQRKLRQVQHQLEAAKQELDAYMGPEMMPLISYQHHHHQQQQQNELLRFGHMAAAAAAMPQTSLVIPYLPISQQEQYAHMQHHPPPGNSIDHS